MTWSIILAAIGWLVAAVALFVAWRFYRRAVILDEVFSYIDADIQTNLMHFGKMLTSNLTSNEPQIVDAHRNMTIMAKRLNEILTRMEEARGVKMRPPPSPPRPKVV